MCLVLEFGTAFGRAVRALTARTQPTWGLQGRWGLEQHSPRVSGGKRVEFFHCLKGLQRRAAHRARALRFLLEPSTRGTCLLVPQLTNPGGSEPDEERDFGKHELSEGNKDEVTVKPSADVGAVRAGQLRARRRMAVCRWTRPAAGCSSNRRTRLCGCHRPAGNTGYTITSSMRPERLCTTNTPSIEARSTPSRSRARARSVAQQQARPCVNTNTVHKSRGCVSRWAILLAKPAAEPPIAPTQYVCVCIFLTAFFLRAASVLCVRIRASTVHGCELRKGAGRRTTTSRTPQSVMNASRIDASSMLTDLCQHAITSTLGQRVCGHIPRNA